jgi:hypothetical protein
MIFFIIINHVVFWGNEIGRTLKYQLTSILLLIIYTSLFGQSKFTVQKGELSFISNAQLELIKATSEKVQGLIDPTNNQFVFSVPIQSFKGFNSDLQRQHFNDNYMESERFPKASFSGKIIEAVNFQKDSVYQVRAKGDLDVHGQKQNRIIKSKISIKNGIVSIESDFTVPLTDHGISIPKIVNQKIATQIEVKFKASMTRQ